MYLCYGYDLYDSNEQIATLWEVSVNYFVGKNSNIANKKKEENECFETVDLH